MKKKFIKDVDVKGKCVFIRVDFKVESNKTGEIMNDTQIKASIPTLQYLVDNGAKIVCASYLEHPSGKEKPDLTLQFLHPLAQRLSQLLNREVTFSRKIIGEEIETLKSQLKEGEILLLQNLRYHPGETSNDTGFARSLAKNIDIYVNDAFGASLHGHASIQAITKFVPVSVAGLLLKKEIDYLNIAIENPPKNYKIILGGTRISDKIPFITNLVDKAQTILIGGGVAYSFLKAKGIEVGRSKVEEDSLELCMDLLQKAREKNTKIVLPVDHIAALSIEPDVTIRMIKKGSTIPDEMMGLDIGFETIKLFLWELNDSELIIWNGPLGVFEVENFSAGSIEIARGVAASSATSIILGSDSVVAINKAGVSHQISLLSTESAASLRFLSGLKLPGIESLSEG